MIFDIHIVTFIRRKLHYNSITLITWLMNHPVFIKIIQICSHFHLTNMYTHKIHKVNFVFEGNYT